MPSLRVAFPSSTHVRLVGLVSAGDLDIWAYAQAQSLAIVTLDADFHDLSIMRGAPPKVVWLRCRDTSTSAIAQLLSANVPSIRTFLADPAVSYLVLRQG